MPPAASTPPGTPLSPWRHLPNAITLARVALVIPLVWTIAQRQFDAALIIVAIAGFTDALDGFLAKRCGWQSWLGGVLDPIADKLLLIACFVSLSIVGALPGWLMGLVVGRDLVIAVGAAAYHYLIGFVTPQPSILSKITTCIQITMVLAVLVDLTSWFSLPQSLLAALGWLTTLATIVSGVHYVVVWSRKALHAKRREA